MELTPFLHPEGNLPLESVWEIWDVDLDVRAWSGSGRGPTLSHVHLPDGRFEGPLNNIRTLDFDRAYRLRARYRDDSGEPAAEWSEWSEWRHFRTAAFGIPPLTAAGVAADPQPTWSDAATAPIEHGDLVVRLLRAPGTEEEGLQALLIWQTEPRGNVIIFPPGIEEAVQVLVENTGHEVLELPPSRMTLSLLNAVGDRQPAKVYLPATTLQPRSAARFWVARSGATFQALPSETAPVYSRPARETDDAWIAPPGYVVEQVADGLTLPTQVILVSETPAGGRPLLLVMELKGRIWAVDPAGEKWVYADGLVEFTSPQPSGNTGQVGLGGMTLDPQSGDLFVTRTYRRPAPPIEWTFDEERPGWHVFLPSTAAWSSGTAETKVVRYREVPTDGSDWSFAARIEYPRVDGVQRWTAGTAFGLVVYGDKDNAVFFNFQSNRHLVELLAANQRTLELEGTMNPLTGWLRIDYAAERLRFFYRNEADQPWSLLHEIDSLPFTPTRVGINGRNFGRLVGTAMFSDIEADGVLLDPSTLLDDTDQVNATWLHNQVVRLRSTDGGRTASALDVVLDMPDDISHESHQVQDIDLAADGTLFVSVGDGFNPLSARDLTTFLGKILRLNPDGSAPLDNPFYDPEQPSTPISYIYNYGVRNTYGMVVRKSDGRLFCSENGPSRDRLYSPAAGWDMGYDGSDRSMLTHALWTWAFPIAPVGIDVMQTGAFPDLRDWVFMASAGQDFTLGISKSGKRILMFDVDAAGNLRAGPDELLRYEGSARATIIGLAFAADGLYFTTLYNTDPAQNAFVNARLMRVRPVQGDARSDAEH